MAGLCTWVPAPWVFSYASNGCLTKWFMGTGDIPRRHVSTWERTDEVPMGCHRKSSSPAARETSAMQTWRRYAGLRHTNALLMPLLFPCVVSWDIQLIYSSSTASGICRDLTFITVWLMSRGVPVPLPSLHLEVRVMVALSSLRQPVQCKVFAEATSCGLYIGLCEVRQCFVSCILLRCLQSCCTPNAKIYLLSHSNSSIYQPLLSYCSAISSSLLGIFLSFRTDRKF